MLKDISKYNFYGRSQFVRLRGKYTHQCTHCALAIDHISIRTLQQAELLSELNSLNLEKDGGGSGRTKASNLIVPS